jgi:hypothetical protein
MYHQKFDRSIAVPVAARTGVSSVAPRSLDATARLAAALIVLGSPLIILWLIVRAVWNDAKAVGRGIAVFHRGIAEEFTRS